MSQQLINVKGFEELDKFLAELPVKLQRNVVRGALRAAANVVKIEAQALVPVGPTSSENARIYGGYMGALRDSIRVSSATRGGVPSVKLIAGGKSKKSGADVYYAHFVEYGTRPHTITAKNRKGLSFGGAFYQSVQHPGAKWRPFWRPAFDTRGGAAAIAAGAYVKLRLSTKHGLDTADIVIEGE